MGVLDRFERGVENVINSTFARTFKSKVKPVELAGALKKEADSRAAIVDRGRTVVPNEYSISLSPGDHDSIIQWGDEALAEELVAAVQGHATRQRYSLVGNVEVEFLRDESLSTGRFGIVSRTTRTPVVETTSVDPNSRFPLLDIDGQHYYLTGDTTTVGRGSEADIVLDDTGVSRVHIKFDVTPYGTILRDLGSTNGTFVEDQKVSEVTLVDGNAITVGRTTMMYWDAAESSDDD